MFMPQQRRGSQGSLSQTSMSQCSIYDETRSGGITDEETQEDRVEKLIARQMMYLKNWEPPLNYDPAARFVPLRGKLIWTYGVMWGCLVLMIASCIVGGGIATFKVNPMFGPPIEALIKMGALRAPLIRQGEWWRLLWAPFLHAGWFHVIMNFILWCKLGDIVEPDWGFLRTAFVFMISAVSGNLVSATLDPFNVSVGASGGIFGIMGGCVPYIIEYWHTIPQPKCIMWVVLASLIVGLACGFMPYVDNYAHMGGAVGGILAGFLTITQVQMGVMAPKLNSKRKILSIKAQMGKQLKRARASTRPAVHDGEVASRKGSHMSGSLISSSLAGGYVEDSSFLDNKTIMKSKDWDAEKENEFSRRASASTSMGFDEDNELSGGSRRQRFYVEGNHKMIPPSTISDSESSSLGNRTHVDSADCSLRVMGDQTVKNQEKSRELDRLVALGLGHLSDVDLGQSDHTSRIIKSRESIAGDDDRISRRLSTDLLTSINENHLGGRHQLAAASITRHDSWKNVIESQMRKNSEVRLRQDPLTSAEPSEIFRSPSNGIAKINGHIDASSVDDIQPSSSFRRASVEHRSAQSVAFTSPVRERGSGSKNESKVENSVEPTMMKKLWRAVTSRPREKIPPHRRIARRAGLRATEIEIVDDSFDWRSKKAWAIRLIGLIGIVGLWAPMLYFLFICPECYTPPGQIINIGKNPGSSSEPTNPPIILFNAPLAPSPGDGEENDSLTQDGDFTDFGVSDRQAARMLLSDSVNGFASIKNQAKLNDDNDNLPAPPPDEDPDMIKQHFVMGYGTPNSAQSRLQAALDDATAMKDENKIEYLFTWVRVPDNDVDPSSLRLRI